MKGLRITIRMRLYFMIAMAIVFMVIVGVMGLRGMNQADEGLRTVYEDRLVPTGQISGIVERVMDNRIQLVTLLRDPTPANVQARTRTIEENSREIDAIWSEFMATYLTARESQLAEKFTADRKAWYSAGLDPAILALRNGNAPEASRLLEQEVEPRFRIVRDSAQDLLNLQLEVADQVYKDAVAHYVWVIPPRSSGRQK